MGRGGKNNRPYPKRDKSSQKEQIEGAFFL